MNTSNFALSVAPHEPNTTSETWMQFLSRLSWGREAIVESTTDAFQEAIRRGISRSTAYFDVAEKIHRAYCPVNWGALNCKWNEISGCNSAPAFHSLPRPASTSPGHETTSPKATGDRQIHNDRTRPASFEKSGSNQVIDDSRRIPKQDNTKTRAFMRRRDRQRPAASLISYYA